MLAYVAAVVLCLSAVSASGLCAPNEDLLQMLNAIRTSPSYAHMSADNKALIPELISNAHSCHLTSYIYTVGLYKVLDLLDSMTPKDAHVLNNYLKGYPSNRKPKMVMLCKAQLTDTYRIPMVTCPV